MFNDPLLMAVKVDRVIKRRASSMLGDVALWKLVRASLLWARRAWCVLRFVLQHPVLPAFTIDHFQPSPCSGIVVFQAAIFAYKLAVWHHDDFMQGSLIAMLLLMGGAEPNPGPGSSTMYKSGTLFQLPCMVMRVCCLAHFTDVY